SSQWKEIKNTSLQQQIVTLPDGSRVTLKQHSQIKFPAAFEADHREVFLEGEAFFEVTKDNKRPFMVYAQEIVTRVLGTSFTVKALGEKVTVAVKTGKVSVYRKTGAPQQVVLTPNQQAVYGKSAEQVSHTLVQTPEIILPPAEVTKMHFEEAPVSEIFNALEIAYGVDIVYDEAKLAGCSLTTSLLDEPLYTRLNIICKAIGATYAVNDIQVVVESDGCH
ncbi:MAG: FecR family protein, partial [Bacteroidota bacterium]